ncbi:DUF1178 family protein [Thermaurantiacus sp.]|uniref:DUF1178 family protein n=1 Tax=Thermaurantiacus sp. TaxID=2820283 RepID=UPI00298F049F|nr:DUF1178 family protein [Thermaurantiacus sp.]
MFDLICPAGHVVEAWFAHSADFEAQKAQGLLECPVCGSRDMTKAPMAPAVATSPADAPTPAETWRRFVRALKAHVVAHCDWVGADFAQEVRRRHRAGEDRGVWGEASPDEARALVEEEVPVLPLPFRGPGTTDA